ncbi:hypothetical protein D9M71_314540 [compost metagenome]
MLGNLAASHHVQRRFWMAPGDHGPGGKFTAVSQLDAFNLAAFGDDFTDAGGHQHLAAEFLQTRLHGIAQLLHATDYTAHAKTVEEPQQSVIDATAVGADVAGQTGQRAHRGNGHRMLEALTRRLQCGTGHQRHQLRFQGFVLDRGPEHFQLDAQVCLGRVNAHHRQRDVEEHVDDFHERQKRLGVLAAEAADLGGCLLAITPEHQRLTVRVQVHVARCQLYRLEAVTPQPQFCWHMGMDTHRHHVQCTGMNQMLRCFGYQITR